MDTRITIDGLMGDATHPKKGDATHPKKGDATHPKKGDATHPKKGDVAQAKKNYRKARNVMKNLAGPGPSVPKKIPEPPTMIEKKCDDCSETFTTDSKWRSCCSRCTNHKNFLNEISQDLLEKSSFGPSVMLDPETIYPNFMVRVAYTVHSKSHCGYCSDHNDDDVRTRTFTKTIALPLFKKFKSKDFDPNTNEVWNSELLNACYRPKHYYNCHCSDGDSSFGIESATIFKKSDAIKLDD
jgi:hypothetical protein